MASPGITIVAGTDLPYHFLYGALPNYALVAIDQELSYKPVGYDRTDAYLRGDWDGRVQLFKQSRSGSSWYFASGLLSRVTNVLDIFGVPYTVQEATPKEFDPHGFEWVSPLTLRSYQQTAVDKAYAARGGVISLPTGAGKTVVGLKLVSMFDVPTLILCHTRELLYQWRDEIKLHLGVDAGLVGDGQADFRAITVATLQTIGGMIRSGDIQRLEFGMLLLDECLPYSTPVITDVGELPIGEIVENRLPVKVLTHTGQFKRILGYQKIPLVKRLVRVTHEYGDLVCTEDHKILTQRGWIEAGKLTNEDVLYYVGEGDVRVRGVRKGVCDAGLYVYDITVEGDHSFVADGVVVHNCHRVGAEVAYNIAMRCTARIRYGLSATPTRTDNAELKIFAATGPLIANLTPCDLIKAGYLAKPKLTLVSVGGSPGFFSQSWQKEYVAHIVTNDERNDKIVDEVVRLVREGKQTYIHVERVAHMDILYHRLVKEFDPQKVARIWGKTKTDDRQKMLKRFESGSLNVLIGTILKEGVNLPAMDAIVLAGGLSSPVALVQKVGRALRRNERFDYAEIIDFVDNCGRFCKKHSELRYQAFMEYYGDCIEIVRV